MNGFHLCKVSFKVEIEEFREQTLQLGEVEEKIE